MTNEKTEVWKIIHIPDKRPISPKEQPTGEYQIYSFF